MTECKVRDILDPAAFPITSLSGKRALDTYTITELIHWRNTASFGATDLSKRIAFLEKELAMANKERLSKVRWIRRLNTIIARMAFPKRDKHEGV